MRFEWAAEVEKADVAIRGRVAETAVELAGSHCRVSCSRNMRPIVGRSAVGFAIAIEINDAAGKNRAVLSESSNYFVWSKNWRHSANQKSSRCGHG